MNLSNKSIIVMVVILLLTLLILSWGEMVVISKQNHERAELLMNLEAKRLDFLLKREETNLTDYKEIVMQFWENEKKIYQFPREMFISLRKLSNDEILKFKLKKQENVINWKIKRNSSVIAFSIIIRWIEIQPDRKIIGFEIEKKVFSDIELWLKSRLKLNFILFSSEGKIIVSSMDKLRQPINRQNEVAENLFEISTSIKERMRIGSHFIKTVKLEKPMLIGYFPLLLNGKLQAIIGFILPENKMMLAYSSFTLMTGGIIILIVLLLSSFYFISLKRNNSYLKQLYKFTEMVSEGNFSERLEVENNKDFQKINMFLNQMADSLEQMKKYERDLIVLDRLSSLSHLSTGIAHEIKNPLMVIKYASEHINKIKADEKLNEDIAMIEKNIVRIEKVIQKLADFSRPTIDEKKQRYNLFEIFEEVLFFMKKTCENNNISIKHYFDTKNLFANVVKNAIGQVFTNVLMNAIEALPHGGKINIISFISENKGNKEIVWFIKDNGEGINEEDFNNILKPFFTTKSNGIGLGLAIAHQIMNNHGGEFIIELFEKVNSEVKSLIVKKMSEETEETLSNNGMLVKLVFPLSL